MKLILNLLNRAYQAFIWSSWTYEGEQFDSYKRKRYDVFKSTNGNGIPRYKRVLQAHSSCHENEARIIRPASKTPTL